MRQRTEKVRRGRADTEQGCACVQMAADLMQLIKEQKLVRNPPVNTEDEKGKTKKKRKRKASCSPSPHLTSPHPPPHLASHWSR